MVLYFSNRLPLSIRKGINLLLLFLKILTNPLVLSNIKTNGLITSSKYPINYLEPFFVSISFEITILSKKTCGEYLLPSLKTNRTTITML